MAETKSANKGGMTKMEAVSWALDELGMDAKPSQIQQYVRDTFGIEMSPEHITTNKGKIRRGEAGPRKTATTQATPPAAPVQQAEPRKEAPQPPAARGGDGQASGIPLQDILYVKELVGRFGPEQLHTLIDAFAR